MYGLVRQEGLNGCSSVGIISACSICTDHSIQKESQDLRAKSTANLTQTLLTHLVRHVFKGIQDCTLSRAGRQSSCVQKPYSQGMIQVIYIRTYMNPCSRSGSLLFKLFLRRKSNEEFGGMKRRPILTCNTG